MNEFLNCSKFLKEIEYFIRSNVAYKKYKEYYKFKLKESLEITNC